MTNESDALIARTPLPPAWECRCESCQIAVSHGAPEEDRDFETIRDRIAALTAELAMARKRMATAERNQIPPHERRKYPSMTGAEVDPPEVYVTLGFWPDCRCYECYGIHLLGEARTALRAATERADALHAALRWADSHVPGQVQCAECGHIAGGHARDCGYAALAAPQGEP